MVSFLIFMKRIINIKLKIMKTNLKTQLEKFNQGIIIDSEGSENKCFNFYDWFCKDNSLERKAKKLFPKVKTFLKNYPDVNPEEVYVFFKNNCPMNGRLYDDFRICLIETGDVMYTVTPKTGHNNVKENEKSEIWGRENNFKEALVQAKNFTSLFKK